MNKIIVDLSCAGYKNDASEVVSWLSSNVAHMYDIKKNLLAKAPNFTGYPHGHLFGSAFIEGTADELKTFFDLFAREYYDEHTQRDVRNILEAIQRGDSLIRCYRIVWPGRYPVEREDSQMFARMAQVLSFEDRGAGFGHLISARDSMRVQGLWEVTDVSLRDTHAQLKFLNNYTVAFSYYEIGFEFDEQGTPQGADYERFVQCVQKVADRFDEKLAWFDEMIKTDPRYAKN